jgi:spore germination protein GerM
MNRSRAIMAVAIGLAAVALGWALMTGLSRVLRTFAPPDTVDTPTQPAAPPQPAAAVPHIKATLFFGSADGLALVPVEQEIPLAQGTVAQARAVIEAQLTATPPDTLAATIPAGTKLLGVFVSDRNEAFIDLDATVRTKHPGGSMNELFTVYTIVNAIATNLPDIQQVQLLIDGHEVDTLAGHVDLRHPLRKNESLNAAK